MFGILLWMSTLELTECGVCPPTCDTVWDISQLCKIIRPFPRKTENSVLYRRMLRQSSIGVAASGHFLFCVARGTSDAGNGFCRCGLESGVKASGFQHGLSCGLCLFEKTQDWKEALCLGPLGRVPRGHFLWGEGMSEWKNEWMKALSLPTLLSACTLWLGGKMPSYFLLRFTGRLQVQSQGSFKCTRVCVCVGVCTHVCVHDRMHTLVHTTYTLGGEGPKSKTAWHSLKHHLQ